MEAQPQVLSTSRLRFALSGIVLAVVSVLFVPRLAIVFVPDQMVDFYQEWSSARNFSEGYPLYEPLEANAQRYLHEDYSPDDPRHLTVNAHPPTSILLTLPFGQLDYPYAVAVWNALSLLCLAATLLLIVRYQPGEWNATRLLVVVALLLFSYPLREQIKHGQMNLILLLLLSGVWVGQRTDRAWLAGLCLGFAICIKVFPVLLIGYFLLQRSYKVVWHTLAWVAGLSLLTVMVLGWSVYGDFLTLSVPAVGDWRTHWPNVSLPGLWNKLFDPGTRGGPVIPLWRSPVTAKLLTLLTGVGIVGLVWRPLRSAQTIEQRDKAYSLALLAMLLMSPVTWPHSLLLSLLPVMMLWSKRLSVGQDSDPDIQNVRIGILTHVKTQWLFWLCLAVLLVRRSYFDDVFFPPFKKHLPGWPATFPVYTITIMSLPCYALLALFWMQRRLCLQTSAALNHQSVPGKEVLTLPARENASGRADGLNTACA